MIDKNGLEYFNNMIYYNCILNIRGDNMTKMKIDGKTVEGTILYSFRNRYKVLLKESWLPNGKAKIIYPYQKNVEVLS